MLLFVCSNVLADENFTYRKEDLKVAEDLADQAKRLTLDGTHKKWLELEKMLGKHKDVNAEEEKYDVNDFGISFKIFVSRSMGRNLLKEYVNAAKRYQATLVFKGLPDDSWNSLSNLIADITGNNLDEVSMQIDDEAFKEFNIITVPSFVLVKEENIFSENSKTKFDKVSGSVGVRRALEMFADGGELSDVASKMLKNM